MLAESGRFLRPAEETVVSGLPPRRSERFLHFSLVLSIPSPKPGLASASRSGRGQGRGLAEAPALPPRGLLRPGVRDRGPASVPLHAQAASLSLWAAPVPCVFLPPDAKWFVQKGDKCKKQNPCSGFLRGGNEDARQHGPELPPRGQNDVTLPCQAPRGHPARKHSERQGRARSGWAFPPARRGAEELAVAHTHTAALTRRS